ncbi:piggyBac transposable element-derived protein 4-like [Anguilla anguilla]|uniref:piggyBac transposable element-derived protein 4-like n=1 Tax=Anguilla anguilla TaxID=7936 RepID=UPI0015A7FC0D|nr:piggyBac transposable element-derived protein 4-like [Anguilla anguilla]
MNTRPQRYSAKQALDLIQDANEMDSGDEELELDIEFDSASESDSEVETETATTTEFVSEREERANDGTVWVEQTAGNALGRAPSCNILREKAGPTRCAKENIVSPLSSLLCLIDILMWGQIVKYTVAEAHRNGAENWDLSVDELKAFVGLLYLRGITGGKSMNLEDFWSSDLGNPFFNETMSRQRFRDIMRYLRFDDKDTRATRLEKDKFAIISEIWSKFVSNSTACYTPGENITVDEQLFPTKARCRFTQYIATKPDKFGIKFWIAADVETKYMLNAFPYLGKDEARPVGERLADNVVMRLVEPFVGKGRNITSDNFFTSIALANNLHAKKTTLVGTMNKKRREVPPSAKAQNQERFSTTIWRAGHATLTVYQCKPKKNVCILSTMHKTVSIDTDAKKLPETIAHYNATKMGVDVLDQMARLYSVKGGSRRWPVAVFYNILDLAAINAHVLYTQCMNKTISRRRFILELAKELRANHMTAKAAPRRTVLAPLCSPETPNTPQRERSLKRKRCQVSRCGGNKTCDICDKCKRLVCGKCTKMQPKLCLEYY